MSAAGRGAQRIAYDDYPTPAWCVRRLLGAVDLPLQLGARHDRAGDYGPTYDTSHPATWLEPCAGGGAIIRAVNDACAARGAESPTWVGNDIRPEAWHALHPLCSNVFAWDMATPPLSWADWPPDVIITNPPYLLAFPIVRNCVEGVPRADVAMLLRLNFAGSGVEGGRSAWLRAHAPDVYVLPNRPSFAASDSCTYEECGWHTTVTPTTPKPAGCPLCGNKVRRSTTDATEYAWFVWPAGQHTRTTGRFQVLASTPLAERKANE